MEVLPQAGERGKHQHQDQSRALQEAPKNGRKGRQAEKGGTGAELEADRTPGMRALQEKLGVEMALGKGGDREKEGEEERGGERRRREGGGEEGRAVGVRARGVTSGLPREGERWN